MTDIANQTHPSLTLEDAKLEKLSNLTTKNWRRKYHNGPKWSNHINIH